MKKSVPRILLVDDDPLFLHMMEFVAQREGIPLITFNSPKEAYQKVGTLDFDIAILDYNLGLVSGVQLATFIRNRVRSVPAILVSQSDFPRRSLHGLFSQALDKASGPNKILGSALEEYAKA